MALGTITIKSVKERKDGGRAIRAEFAGDSAYPAGGTPDINSLVRAAVATWRAAKGDANVRGYEQLSVQACISQDCGQLVPSYDIDADKLFVRDGGSATWAEASGDISTTTFKVLFLAY